MVEDDTFVFRAVLVLIVPRMEGDCFFDVGMNNIPNLLPGFDLGFENSTISFFPDLPENEAR